MAAAAGGLLGSANGFAPRASRTHHALAAKDSTACVPCDSWSPFGDGCKPCAEGVQWQYRFVFRDSLVSRSRFRSPMWTMENVLENYETATRAFALSIVHARRRLKTTLSKFKTELTKWILSLGVGALRASSSTARSPDARRIPKREREREGPRRVVALQRWRARTVTYVSILCCDVAQVTPKGLREVEVIGASGERQSLLGLAGDGAAVIVFLRHLG